MRPLSILFLLTGLVLAGAGPELATPAQRGWRGSRFQSGRTPVQIYAHRGGRSYAPEGTLMAYAAALRMGVDFVDLDVVVTQDQQLLVAHDLYLNPDLLRDEHGAFLGGGRGREAWLASLGNSPDFGPFLIHRRTLAEMMSFDAGRLHPDAPAARLFPDQAKFEGARLPTLREVIRLVKGAAGSAVGFQIEMKTDPDHPDWSPSPNAFARLLVDLLAAEGVSARCEIQAFDWRCLEAVHRLDPRPHTAYLSHGRTQVPEGSIPRRVRNLGGHCWDPQDVTLTREALEEAHRLGLKVVVWRAPEASGSVMDGPLLDRLLAWGVDGIITDDPARLAGFLASRGRRIPPRIEVGQACSNAVMKRMSR